MLQDARKETDKLFDLVRPEFLYERPIAERHRIVFYMGHLEAFDWNLLRPHMRETSRFDEGLDRLFAFGIDPIDGGLPKDGPSDWPSMDEVLRYRRTVREMLDGAQHDAELMHTAIEHRLMHAETLSYMLHQLPLEAKRPEARTVLPASGPVQAEVIEIPAGRATLGQPRNGNFGWDNEFDEHIVDVPAFAIDRYKVTNAQYLHFVEGGGYNDRRLWDDVAWRWKEQAGIAHPVFWKRNHGRAWRYRTMFDEIALPLEWPVYVSHAEASAYARWSGARLPSEAEWHRAAYATPEGEERPYPWGGEVPAARHGYFDFALWDPSPVNAFPCGRSPWGVEGLLANGWEWTRTPFAPFEGFAPRPYYPGYSADFFDGKHFVLKGGSTRTAACMLRRGFRNWFQAHYQYVYAGFRLAKPGSDGTFPSFRGAASPKKPGNVPSDPGFHGMRGA
jgi:ergothioneine biosynthesis protein EgtB